MPDSSQVATCFSRMCGDDRAAALLSKRELWSTVRHAGRPGASEETAAVVGQLIGWLSKDAPLAARRELLWMLSELGGDESVEPIAALLGDVELREDARMVLERIPGGKSLEALEQGLADAPEDFKINLAQSLRSHGMTHRQLIL